VLAGRAVPAAKALVFPKLLGCGGERTKVGDGPRRWCAVTHEPMQAVRACQLRGVGRDCRVEALDPHTAVGAGELFVGDVVQHPFKEIRRRNSFPE
jgi:hypothetical protein